MSLAIRPASPSEDREEMIGLLERNLPGSSWAPHFKWRNEDNPAGVGWSWVIYDRASGAILAMTSLFPRPVYMDGKLLMCGQVAQFAVDKPCRSLGPALMLQKATLGPVNSGTLAFCYDCPPHEPGVSTFTRLGMRPSCELTRYALLLRSDEVLGKKLGKGAWTKPLIAGANLLLTLRRNKPRVTGLEVSRLEGRFGDEFTHLDKIVPSAGIVRSSRSAELLNWRYCDRFEPNVEVLAARRGGELLAFLSFIIYPDGTASVLDLFGLNLDQAGPALLDAMIETCRRKNVNRIDGYCADTSELRPVFLAAGFRPREKAARVFAYSKLGEPYREITSSVSWPLGQAELNA